MENGKIETIFPLIANTKWKVIALTCTNSGVPESAEGRLAIFEQIRAAAKEFGIAENRLLIDPIVQREILTQQSLAAAAGDPEAMQLDEDFLNALEFGAPPMGGMGMGVDRVVMLFTNKGIRETILFPLLKPQG